MRTRSVSTMFGRGALALAASAAALSALAEPTVELRVIAASGWPAPGTPGVFESFSQIWWSDSGRAAFEALLELDPDAGIDVANGVGAWADRFGALTLEARAGDAPPGAPGEAFRGSFAPRINATGDLMLYASLTDGPDRTESGRGVWSDRDGALALVVRTGDAAPGLPGLVFDRLPTPPVFGENGAIALRAGVSGPGVTLSNDTGVWTDASGLPALLAREGDPAPGALDAVFGDFMLASLGASELGDALVRSSLAVGPGGVTLQNDACLWAQSGGALALVAREGDPAPGTTDFFAGAYALADTSGDRPINNDGYKSFVATLKASPESLTVTGTGLYSDRSGALALLLRSGDAAPGTGLSFSSLSLARQNGAGAIAVQGVVHEPSESGGAARTGIWAERGGVMTLVALEGAPAPGTDTVFSSLTTALGNQFRYAADERVLFWGRLAHGGGTHAGNDFAYWMTDDSGAARLLLREGQAIDLAGDGSDMRTLAEPQFTANETPRLNSQGEALLLLHFADASSALVGASLAEETGNPADLNADGVVDGTDLGMLLLAWGVCADPDNCPADLDGDGVVNGTDLGMLLLAWGS